MVKEESKRDQFIESNLGLVHSICKRFSGRGIEYDDLYQAGCIGLIKACDAFDEERGFCFSTYAVPVIMGEVRRLFRDSGSVKVSRAVKELAIKINREGEKFEKTNGRQATVSELSQILSVSPIDITEAICATQATVSLTFEGEDGIKETDLPVTSEEEEISDRIVLQEAMKKLSQNERQIMKYRYFNFLTQSKTAQLLNMSQVQVSRTEKRILLKLKGMLE
ncbi:MAG: sigma-70 family RNA polymerase sigma factor [Clostridia bacterium]|nr:sigma-70 family RNA polymerase sigma factor [Clostridia bacterium]